MRHGAIEAGLLLQLPKTHFCVKHLFITLFLGDRSPGKVKSEEYLPGAELASMPMVLGAGARAGRREQESSSAVWGSPLLDKQQLLLKM